MPKPSRSPLYFYALEYQRKNGRKSNINEAIAACYDDWKALSDEEKQVYKDQYEQWRMDYRSNPQSVNVSNQNRKPKKDIQTNEKVLHQRDIPCEQLKTHYDRFSLEKDFLACQYLPLDINELLSMPIYIINFQIFCKIDEEDGGGFIPAEMCILRYTLADGVTLYRQNFIKADKIPSGYMSSCLEHSKETHEIPIKDFPEAIDNYKKIYQDLKAFLIPTVINKINNVSNSDERTRRRYLRSIQPCVFFPALEYEQTSALINWLQEKAEGIKPTKDTRLVNLASIESLIMVLAELKQQRVARDQIQKTFENAAYSFMIEERCRFHSEIGISHCSVARCHAGAKLISAYLNQLYAPERSPSTTMTDKYSRNTCVNNANQSAIESMNNTRYQRQHSATTSFPRPRITSQRSVPNHYPSTDTSDSIASSYRPPQQRNQQNFYQQDDEITRLQQKSFQRLLSNAQSEISSHNDKNYLDDYTIEGDNETNNYSDGQRSVLNHRKQVLLKAIQSIDKQLEELDTE